MDIRNGIRRLFSCRGTVLLRAATGLLLLVIGGCDQASLMKRFTPSQDESIAKSYIDLLRQKHFDQVERGLDPSIKGPNIRDTLATMAEMIPAQEPTSVKVVGSHAFHGKEFSTTDLTFEYEFAGKWLLIQVAMQKKFDVSTIMGFHVQPISDSLENLNKFRLVGKTALHYVVLALAILAPLFSVYVLVLCARTKIEKRKWLWVLFIIVGVGKFGVNWATGQWQCTPLAVQLPPAGAFAQLYGPWTVYFSLPLGAVAFLLWRKQKLGSLVSPPNPSDNQILAGLGTSESHDSKAE
jgi:hypothetical protein